LGGAKVGYQLGWARRESARVRASEGRLAMPELAEVAQVLDSCYTVFLREISEPEENVLRLVLQEANANSETVSLKADGTTIENLRRIESTERSRTFELRWNQYIAYSVRNESFALQDDSELHLSGRLMRLYSKSHFLDYVSRATLANEQYPGPYTHVRILSENHVVDVISTQSPEIRLLQPAR
jgi:hypothetical protein